MNPAQIGEIVAILVGIIGMGLILSHALDLWEERRNKAREDTATAIRNARRAGYLQGANLAMQTWGAHVRTINRMDFHGFAEACRKCGTLTMNLISATEEYWSCHQCQHRNPAPLPPHLRPQPAATTPDPAKHDDP